MCNFVLGCSTNLVYSFNLGVYLSKQCKVYQESQLYPESGKKRQLEKCNSR